MPPLRYPRRMDPRRHARYALLLLGALALSACGGGSGSTHTGPSYELGVGLLQPTVVSASKASVATVLLTPLGGYHGTVHLSCEISGSGTPPPSCSIAPSVITLTGTAAVTATLTVTAANSTPGGSYPLTVSARDSQGLAPSNGAVLVSLKMAATIRHVVVLFQENRTPDNLFQDPVLIARGADIATAGLDSHGALVPLMPMDLGTAGALPQTYDLSHAHRAFVDMYDGGRMDGADKIGCAPAAACPAGANSHPQFRYVLPSDVQPYFALAEHYTFGDRMFQTNQGPSFPAHQFIIAGTSAPSTASPLFAAENSTPTAQPTGCIAPSSVVVAMIDAAGSESAQPGQYPCFEHPTLTDLLTAAGVSWRYYTPSAGSIWTGPVAIAHICEQQNVQGTLSCSGSEWTRNVVLTSSAILSDVANGNLAQVSWVIPDGRSSDHAMINDGSGPSWIGSIVNAIGASRYWSDTAIIITWDDWGGWYDHVAPRVIDDGVSWGSGYVYGFRVPLIIVSPYAKAAYISHQTHDFGSILRFIEVTFGLRSLGYADAYADDLADCFDLTQSPLKFETVPTTLGAGHFLSERRAPLDPDDD